MYICIYLCVCICVYIYIYIYIYVYTHSGKNAFVAFALAARVCVPDHVEPHGQETRARDGLDVARGRRELTERGSAPKGARHSAIFVDPP